MSWQQLSDMIKLNRERLEEAKRDAPVACPIDGEILDVHPDGRRNCPLGNYRWPN